MDAEPRKPLLWLIDRSAGYRAHLQQQLDQHCFDVRTFPDSRNVERRLARERPAALLLERELDGEDGLALCQRIRGSGDDIPIVFISTLNTTQDRIAALNAGADDYLGKPFDTGELIARIQALLRRRHVLPAGAPQLDAQALQFGECELIAATCTLLRLGKKVELTTGEFAVLSTLARHANRPLTRERLIELTRSPNSNSSERSIDVQISRLRRLVELNPEKPRHIQTVWGYGYVFVPA